MPFIATRIDRGRTRRLCPLTAAISVWLFLGALASANAQSVTRVYPRFVVAGQEMHFTAEGSKLPVESNAALGLKFAFDKPAVCIGGQRDKPTTATRYYFSCQFQPGVKLAKLRVFHKPSTKASLKLWDGTLQVLDGAPKVDALLLLSPVDSGQSAVDCQAGQPCITFVGSPQVSKPLAVEVTGSNLPHTLTLEGLACQALGSKPDLADTSLLHFQCQVPSAGEQGLLVLTAPRSEGGQVLLTSRINVLAAAVAKASQ